MPASRAINTGVMTETTDSEDVEVDVYYDANYMLTHPGGDPNLAPLINNPSPLPGRTAYCLEVINKSGSTATIVVTNNKTGQSTTVKVPQGDPVTSGAGRSRTAAQVASQLGMTVRGDVSFSIADQ